MASKKDDIDLTRFNNIMSAKKQNGDDGVNLSRFNKMMDLDEPSKTESFLRGAADEVTLGGAPKIAGALSGVDEFQGAAKSLYDLIPLLDDYGSSDPDVKAYETARNESQANFDKAFEANPWSYRAGGLTGGVGLGVATGALGLLPKAAEGASYARQLYNAGKMGFGFGGAHGLISSKGDTLGEKAVDAALGAGLGAVTAPVVKVGLDAGFGLVKKLIPEKIQTAHSMGKNEGESILHKDGRREIEDIQKSATAKDIYGKLNNIFGELKNAYDDLRTKYKFTDVDGNLSFAKIFHIIDQLDDNVDEQAADKLKLKNLLTRYIKAEQPEAPAMGEVENFLNYINSKAPPQYKTSLKANDMANLKGAFSDYSPYGKGMSSTQGENAAKQAAGILGENLRVIPEFAKADADYNIFLEDVMGKMGLKGLDEQSAVNALMQKLKNYSANTDIGSATRVAVDEGLESLGKINPDLANSLRSQIQHMSDKIQVAREAINAPMPKGGNTLSDIKGFGLQISNAVGLAQNKISTKAGDITGTVTKFLSGVPKRNLNEIGQSMIISPSAVQRNIGQMLVNASERDDIGRNAIIFSLMQNTAYRDALRSTLGFTPYENQQ